jgi:hypothetical protein
MFKGLFHIAKAVFVYHAPAWEAAMEPINKFLNESDHTLRDNLTKAWCENVQKQLNTILVTVCP